MMIKMGWREDLILLLCVCGLCAANLTCGRGQHLNVGKSGEKDTCSRCPEDYFQHEESHRKDTCHKCDVFDEYEIGNKILWDNCTRFHDLIVQCKKGFFLVTSLGDCQPCTNCTSRGKYEAQACSKTADAVCCDAEDMLVREGECVAPEHYCGGQPGEFLRLDQECVPCEKCKPCGFGSGSGQVCLQIWDFVLIIVGTFVLSGI